MTTRVMIVAGEVSGDFLGAGLVRALRDVKGDIEFFGVAGDAMQAQGVRTLFDQEELNIMGIVEVLPKIPHILGLKNKLVAEAQAKNIDMLITIDAPDFCLRLARDVKRVCGVPCVHYVSPSIWAWRQNRVFKMAQFLDHVLALFPFEPPLYEPAGLPCTFVGHPILERLAPYMGEPKAVSQNKLALVPGSRRRVIARMLPEMLATFDVLKRDNPELRAVIPLARDMHKAWVDLFLAGRSDVRCVVGEGRYEALQACDAALVTSGTSNLEVGVLGVPMVVAYKTNALTYFIAKNLVNVPYISPVNWVLGEKVVPECVQHEACAQTLAAQLAPLFDTTSEVRRQQCAQLATLRTRLKAQNGHEEGVSQHAAAVVLRYLEKK